MFSGRRFTERDTMTERKIRFALVAAEHHREAHDGPCRIGDANVAVCDLNPDWRRLQRAHGLPWYSDPLRKWPE